MLHTENRRWWLLAKVVAMVWLITGLQSCNQFQNSQATQTVSVSIAPLQYFVDRLTDSVCEVNVMVPTGSSHATYSPTPQQFRKLSDSDIYFRIGYLDYEQAWIDRFQELNKSMKLVNLSDYVELIRGEEVDHGNHKHEGGVDPHIWMSPLVIRDLLPVMRDVLVEEYPELAETITSNYSILMGEVEALHKDFTVLSETLTNKAFMIYHPALTYLARDYGFTQVSIEHEGKEPSPAMLGRIIRDAREYTTRVIFIQEEYDMRSAELISQETGARLLQINPMAYDWMESMHDLKQLMQANF